MKLEEAKTLKNMQALLEGTLAVPDRDAHSNAIQSLGPVLKRVQMGTCHTMAASMLAGIFLSNQLAGGNDGQLRKVAQHEIIATKNVLLIDVTLIQSNQ